MVYDRAGVKAHKSYFFADDLMVALGSGIEVPNITNMVTTVEQRFYGSDKPSVYSDIQAKWQPKGSVGF